MSRQSNREELNIKRNEVLKNATAEISNFLNLTLDLASKFQISYRNTDTGIYLGVWQQTLPKIEASEIRQLQMRQRVPKEITRRGIPINNKHEDPGVQITALNKEGKKIIIVIYGGLLANDVQITGNPIHGRTQRGHSADIDAVVSQKTYIQIISEELTASGKASKSTTSLILSPQLTATPNAYFEGLEETANRFSFKPKKFSTPLFREAIPVRRHDAMPIIEQRQTELRPFREAINSLLDMRDELSSVSINYPLFTIKD